ncbi:MAG: dynamin family protein [Pseudomonadota bacterium]
MMDGTVSSDKPCVALMGEFSAGKSTLANLLIGADPLPVQVVATQLPPVWISYGTQSPYRMDLEGVEHPIDITALASAPLEDTCYIRIFREEDILQQCDLLDMPGISDPNMSSDVWQRMIAQADAVIWCSHATQAWRQSEAAVWSEMDPDLYERSILLLTRIDKILSLDDRERVLRRVRKETEGLFSTCLPISLLQATREQEDYEAWSQTGAGEFAKTLAQLLAQLQVDKNIQQDLPVDVALGVSAFQPPARPEPELPAQTVPASQVIPRRITASGQTRRPPPRQ